MSNISNFQDSPFLFDLFKRFEKYALTYVFRGVFVPALTDKILALAETNMTLFGEVTKKQKKVYFVMVESLQNITRHQDAGQNKNNKAFFVLQNKNGKYGMASGNVIENENIESLQAKLDIINSLDADALKTHYKDVLENTGLSEKGGAGLGLIEIARRSGSKLSYRFNPLDEKISYFYFKTKINTDSETEDQSQLNGTKELHHFAIEHDINLVYQGFFTNDNLKSLLTMVEGSVGDSDLSFKRKAVSVMVELLQNICNHGSAINPEIPGKPGILVISAGTNDFKIMSGNYIANETVSHFKNKVNKINTSNNEELDALYSETIMKEHEPGQKGAGLGFIDMKMKSSNKIDYSIVDFNGNFSFLSVTVSISF